MPFRNTFAAGCGRIATGQPGWQARSIADRGFVTSARERGNRHIRSLLDLDPKTTLKRPMKNTSQVLAFARVTRPGTETAPQTWNATQF